jgi:hypothetical protein
MIQEVAATSVDGNQLMGFFGQTTAFGFWADTD